MTAHAVGFGVSQDSPDLNTALSPCSQGMFGLVAKKVKNLSHESSPPLQCSAFAPKSAGISHIQLKLQQEMLRDGEHVLLPSFLAATWLWDRVQISMKTKGTRLPLPRAGVTGGKDALGLTGTKLPSLPLPAAVPGALSPSAAQPHVPGR